LLTKSAADFPSRNVVDFARYCLSSPILRVLRVSISIYSRLRRDVSTLRSRVFLLSFYYYSYSYYQYSFYSCERTFDEIL
jgi:hypothetical protein